MLDGLSYPVIVVPGITATYLDDHYTLPPDKVWSVINKDYDRSALHPDNLRFEATEPALVRGGQLFEICYRELIEELRYNLRARETEPVPVYPFSYDWRQPLDDTAEQLGRMIDEVIARTLLMRHYDKKNYGADPKVNLVGHSMGGLVITSYLRRFGSAKKVAKVVTLATPYRGSFEAVIKIATGTANLGTSPPSSREREAARMTPSLYHLLPDLPDAMTIEDASLPKTLFDPAVWQPSITETIAEYIRLRGLRQADRQQQARTLFKVLLDDAKATRQALAGFKLDDTSLSEEDWLCVVGVDADTRVALKIAQRQGRPEFEFRSSDRDNKWGNADDGIRRRTGDGTVPYDGAIPHFLPLERLVCVRPHDYGYWELTDRAATQFAGFHGILPNMDMLHRLIVRFFKKQRDTHGNTWGSPPVGVSKESWRPPLVGGLEAKNRA